MLNAGRAPYPLDPLAIDLRDVGALLAAEGTRPATFQASIEILRDGQFDFGTYSPNIIKVDSDMMAKMVEAFALGARGKNGDGTAADLPVDIDHETREAAGWITGLTVAGGSLMATIDWNSLGVELIAGDRFRWMSVMFSENYKDPEGKSWGTTLWGAAVTNYPRIKDMAALSLTAREVGRDAPKPEPSRTEPQGGNDMDTKLIATALGLADDATDEQIVAAAEALKSAPEPTDSTETAALKAEIVGMRESVTALETAKEAAEARAATLDADACIAKHTESGRLTAGHLVDAEGNPNALAKLATVDLEAFDLAVASFPVVVEYGTRGAAGAPLRGGAMATFEAAIDKEVVAGLDYASAVAKVKATQPAVVAAAYPTSSQRV